MSSFAIAAGSLSGMQDILKGRLRWRVNVWMIGVLLTVVASIVSSLSYTAKADREVDRQFASKLALYCGQAERINQLERLKNQEAGFCAQAAFDASLIDAVPPSRALAEVENALSPGIQLMGISLDAQMQASTGNAKSTVSAAPADVAAKVLRIDGVVSSDSQLSQFLTKLAKSPWFEGVSLLPVATNSSNGTVIRPFEVQAIFGEHPESLSAGTRQ